MYVLPIWNSVDQTVLKLPSDLINTSTKNTLIKFKRALRERDTCFAFLNVYIFSRNILISLSQLKINILVKSTCATTNTHSTSSRNHDVLIHKLNKIEHRN